MWRNVWGQKAGDSGLDYFKYNSADSCCFFYHKQTAEQTSLFSWLQDDFHPLTHKLLVI